MGFQIDARLFPNSQHFRVWLNVDGLNAPPSDDQFSAMIQLGNGHENDNEQKAYNRRSVSVHPQQRRAFRTVSCCCAKLICDSHTVLRIQSYFSALSFWSFLGVLYTLGLEYVVLPSCVFVLSNALWNPLFYSKTLLRVRRDVWCCSPRKWLYYVLLCLAYVVGFGVNLTWTAFSLSALILEDASQIQHAEFINLGMFAITTLLFLL